jgi:hypothetical protein
MALKMYSFSLRNFVKKKKKKEEMSEIVCFERKNGP